MGARIGMGNIDKGGQEGVIYEGRCARGKEHDKMGLRRSSWLILSSPASPVLDLIVQFSSEEEDMRFRLVYLVMNPSDRLNDAQAPPLAVGEKPQDPAVFIEKVVVRNELEEPFW